MWETMMSKEELPGYRRDIASWFSQRALLQPRMRVILLNWLMEVVFTTFSFHVCMLELIIIIISLIQVTQLTKRNHDNG